MIFDGYRLGAVKWNPGTERIVKGVPRSAQQFVRSPDGRGRHQTACRVNASQTCRSWPGERMSPLLPSETARTPMADVDLECCCGIVQRSAVLVQLRVEFGMSSHEKACTADLRSSRWHVMTPAPARGGTVADSKVLVGCAERNTHAPFLRGFAAASTLFLPRVHDCASNELHVNV